MFNFVTGFEKNSNYDALLELSYDLMWCTVFFLMLTDELSKENCYIKQTTFNPFIPV